MKKLNFLTTIFILTFILIISSFTNVKAEERQNPDRSLTQEYYIPENYDAPAIKMYEEFDTQNNKLIYKYEMLNEAIVNTGFNNFTNNNGTYKFYLLENNEIARGFYKINNKYFYFNKYGYAQYGWQYINNNKYFFDTTTGEAYSGIKTINNKNYYFSSKGMIITGLKKINGYIYYFTENGMQYKWQKINDDYYYFNKDGKALKGFKTINDVLYYFDSNGVNKSGIIKQNNNYYCLYKHKLIKNSWIKSNGKYYYFDNYYKAVKGWQTINNKKYYFKSNGTMATGFVKIGKYKYFFSKQGQIRKGLRIINNHKYYFNSKGHMYFGLKTINKKIYYFQSTTGKSVDGFIKYRGNYYYLKNHKYTKNKWKKINGKYYYFNKDGKAYKSTTKKISKVYYKFTSEAQAINGYFKKNNNIYYKDAKGNIITGKKYIFGIKQYFSRTGIRTTYKKVIDVSEFQNKINWELVRDTYVQGAILRLGFTGTESKKNIEDAYFEYNIKKTQDYGIPVGIYYYGYAKTTEEATKEANFVLETLKKYGNPTLKYPIFYDAEEASVGKSNYIKVIPTFAKVLEENGYEVGVYGNAHAFYSSNGYLNNDTIKQYPIWVAHYNTNYSDHYISGYKSAYGWQYTSSASVNGIKTRVDMSNWYK